MLTQVPGIFKGEQPKLIKNAKAAATLADDYSAAMYPLRREVIKDEREVNKT